MRDAHRPEDEVAWPRFDPLVADEHGEAAIDHVPGLVCVMADVQRGAARRLRRLAGIGLARRSPPTRARWTSSQRTNVLRQGANSKPCWFVNLSVPGREEGSVSRLTVVKIDANTGKVEEVVSRR